MSEQVLMWTMLALLCGQFVCFLLSVGYVLSQGKPDASPSCRHRALLLGGVGFLMFGSNGMLASQFVWDGNLTKWLGLLLYLLGMLLIALGLHFRKLVLSQDRRVR